MKNSLILVSILLCANAAVSGVQNPEPPPPATTFPGKLLDGPPDFNLALLLQGDIRGNFGPCG